MRSIQIRWLTGFLLLALAAALTALYLGRPSAAPQKRAHLDAALVPQWTTMDGEPAPAPAPRLVTLDYPRDATVDRSGWLRLSLPAAGSRTPAGATGAGPAVDSFVLPVEVQSTEVSLQEAFGPGYALSAEATLIATTFDVGTVGATNQPLERGVPSWTWNLLPQKRGVQVVTMSVELLWTPLASGTEIRRTVWQGQIEYEVDEPWFTSGPRVTMMKIAAWVLGAAGTIILMPLMRTGARAVFGRWMASGDEG